MRALPFESFGLVNSLHSLLDAVDYGTGRYGLVHRQSTLKTTDFSIMLEFEEYGSCIPNKLA